MAERQVVVDQEKINYEGLFLIKDLIKIVYDWANDKGYVPLEPRHTEVIKDNIKTVEIDFTPYKKVTDFAKNLFQIKLTCSDITEVVIEQEGKRKKIDQGKVQIVFTAWLETDYEQRWETKPIFYILRTAFEKYVYTPFLSGYRDAIRTDTTTLQDQFKSYLNLYKYV